MNVLVVGAGAMGRWFAETVRASDAVDGVAFADADPDTATAAADSLDGRAVALDTDERFDAVCLAVPMPVATDAIAAAAPLATDAVLDVTGSAAGPVEAMREHAPERERVSLHPLFAPENAPGNVAVVTDKSGPVTDALLAAIGAAGNHCFATSAEEHDRAMETVQAKAHAAVLAFGLAADDVPEGFQTPVSSALFDLVEQVAGGDSRVYADIQATFEGAADVAAAAQDIAAADPAQFRDLYDSVGEYE